MRIPAKGEYQYYAEVGAQQRLRALEKKLRAAEDGSGLLQLREDFRRYRERAEQREKRFEKGLADAERRHANELAAQRNMWMQTNDDVVAYAEQMVRRARRESRKETDRVYALLRTSDEANEELRTRNRELKEELAAALAKIAELEDRVAEKDLKLNRDHTNSSIATSQERVGQKKKKKKVCSSRSQSGMPRGAQKKHKRQPRPELIATSEPVWVVPDDITTDPLWKLIGYREHRLADLRVVVECVPYRYGVYRHVLTGEIYKVPIPDAMHDDLNYGPMLKSLCLMLTAHGNMPSRKVAEFVRDITDGELPISNGFVASLMGEFAGKSTREREEIVETLMAGPFMNVDNTGCKVNGEQRCVSVNCNGKASLLVYSRHKGVASLENMPYKDYEGSGVHDQERTYDGKPSKIGDKGKPKKGHQFCLAHMVRYLTAAEENEPDLSWARKMRGLLQLLCHERKLQPPGGPDEEYKAWARNLYDSFVDLGEEEYRARPPRKYFRDGENLWKTFKREKESILYFLDHPEVPHTNNDAERQLRNVKRRQAAAVTFRAASGPENYCRVMSVLQTERMHERNIFTKALEVFSRVGPPKTQKKKAEADAAAAE